MKKNLSIIVVLILLLSLFVSCTLHDNSTTSVAELGVARDTYRQAIYVSAKGAIFKRFRLRKRQERTK